jgi:hypothetical protein
MSRYDLLLAGILVLLASGCLQEGAAAEEMPGAPRDLEIIFADGQAYTSEMNVDLLLFARGASECRLSNDNQSWEAWKKYARSAQWTLSEGDGTKRVFYQCRNSLGNVSLPVATTIILDSTPPSIDVESPAEMQRYVNRFDIVFTANDSVSQSLVCSAELDGKEIDVGVVTSGRKQNISVRASEGMHNVVIRCSDSMFDSEVSIDFEIVKAPVVALMINDGSGYTDTKNVTLNVASPTASDCRFSNKNEGWSEWLPYETRHL